MTTLNSNQFLGKVRAYHVFPQACNAIKTGIDFDGEIWRPVTQLKQNTVLYQWTEIASKLLANGTSSYRISGMYLEFENVASPGTAVTVPTFDRTRTVDYYNELAGSSTRDYLRVSLTGVQTLSEGDGLTNNKLLFFARSSGTSGVHGKPFSDANNSVIFGASLAAFPDNNDATQDLLFSSFYFSVAEQQPKLATSQVGVEWELTLQ